VTVAEGRSGPANWRRSICCRLAGQGCSRESRLPAEPRCMTRRSGRFVRRHSKAGSGTATSTTRTATQTPRRRRSSVLKRIASSGWTGRGRQALRRVGLATYKSRARSTPSRLSWHLTESLRSVSPSEVGAPGGIRTPNLLIRRSRPSVQTDPAGRPPRPGPQSAARCESLVVRGWLCDLAPRMAPGFAILILRSVGSHRLSRASGALGPDPWINLTTTNGGCPDPSASRPTHRLPLVPVIHHAPRKAREQPAVGIRRDLTTGVRLWGCK